MKKKQNILALDLALITGWCVGGFDGKLSESGIIKFTRSRNQSTGVIYLKFRHWLNDICDTTKPALIAYEQAHHRGGPATEIAIALTTRVKEIAEEREVEFLAVHSATIKKHACGSGNASKEMMIARAKVLLGRDPVDDNEADAVCLYACVVSQLGGN